MRGVLLRRLLASQTTLSYVGVLLLFGVVSLLSPGFGSPSHIRTLITVAAFTGIAAIGQTIVIIGGGIDLSIPWTLNCAAVLVTEWSGGRSAALVWAVPVIVAGGALLGAVNGSGIALLSVPPIVMTLATNVILQGLLLVATKGFPPPPAPARLVSAAAGRVGPIPSVVLIWLTLAALTLFVERRTVFGRQVYAVGTNRVVAQLSGLPIRRITILSYTASGAAAAATGILLAGYSRQSYLGMGNPYLFTTIAAVAIGGTSVLGGSGTYLGTIAGALMLTVLSGLLPIFRLDEGALQVIYGGAILLTVALASPKFRSTLERLVRGTGAPPPTSDP